MTQSPTFPCEGGCACGAVRYRLLEDPLDVTRWLEPIAHIWTSSAQPWVEIPTEVLTYERQPRDSLELVRAWKGRNHT